MRPSSSVGHELFEKERRGNRAALPVRRRIDDVRDLTVEHFPIRIEERHSPDGIFHFVGCSEQSLGQLIVIAEHRRQIGSQCDSGRPGEGREIEHELRGILTAEGQRVAHHEAPLGIGIVDFDADTLARSQNVTGMIRIAGNGVLHRRNQQSQPDRQPMRHDHVRKADSVRRAAHVLLHQTHARRRLDVQAPAVEANALANQSDLGIRPIAPFKIDETRKVVACPTYRMNDGQVPREQPITLDNVHTGAKALAKGLHGGSQLPRHHVLRGCIDEITDLVDGLRLMIDGFQIHTVRHAQPRQRRFRVAITRVLIRAKRPAQRGTLLGFARPRRIQVIIPFGQLARQRTQHERIIGGFNAHQHPLELAMLSRHQTD